MLQKIFTQALWIFSSMALAGCLEGGAPVSKETQIGITLQAPKGYCVDEKITGTSRYGDHVIFGNCAALSSSVFLPEPKHPAVLIASTLNTAHDNIVANVAELDQFLRSPAGQRYLSRGRDTAILQESFIRKDIYTLVIIEENPKKGLQKRYWRGFMDINGATVALSVHSLEKKPLSNKEGLNLVAEFASSIRKTNNDDIEKQSELAAILDNQAPSAASGVDISPVFTIGLFREVVTR